MEKTFIDRMLELPEAQIVCINDYLSQNEEIIINIPIATYEFKKAAELYGYTLAISLNQSGYYKIYIIAPSIRRSELIENKYETT